MNAPDRYERFVVPEGTKKLIPFISFFFFFFFSSYLSVNCNGGSSTVNDRVSYERDTKIINAASFTIEREDHTVGNVLRMQLHRDESVLFAGYKLPHPLQYKIIVRGSGGYGFEQLDWVLQIHTTSQSSPMQAYNQAINDLDKELNHLKRAFEDEMTKHPREY
ncbi:hypothetical protein HHK36_011903 [Tetracentron sinense]|uniref:DNA-directed RNA polymerase RBP11-like dimerisation domain-containing protein n=1 Tax=Tetracentron sinense TaxID=13715 RepID=A0A834ZBT7_TETSI|nr:hypothetical protein HHK36_011903 [Tetracentron sinense]